MGTSGLFLTVKLCVLHIEVLRKIVGGVMERSLPKTTTSVKHLEEVAETFNTDDDMYLDLVV